METGNYINGKQVGELEEELATYSKCKYCVAVSSGTDALLVALLALGISNGDEVLTTPFTWISTSEVIALIGAIPVFVDIDEETFNINPDLIEEKINDRTKAILTVSMFGQMANYIKINDIAKKYNLPVIDDAAQSFSATIDDKMSPYYNTVTCTSFFPTKIVGGFGDGGAILTNNKELVQKMKSIRNHGQSLMKDKTLNKFNHQYIGTNSRLDTMKAALLQVKLKYLPKSIEKRKEIANYYNRKLLGCQTIKCPVIKKGYTSVWANYTITVPSKEIRDTILNKMKEVDINLSIFYPKPLHLQPCFKYLGYGIGDFQVSEKICDRVISLPCYPELTRLEQDYIINKLLYSINYQMNIE